MEGLFSRGRPKEGNIELYPPRFERPIGL